MRRYIAEDAKVEALRQLIREGEESGPARAFDWDEGQFRRIARAALDAAFCDADTKVRIAKLLEV